MKGQGEVACRKKAEVSAGRPEQKIDQLMRCVVSVVVMGIATYLIVARTHDTGLVQWARGVVQVVLSYWIGTGKR